MPTGLVKPFSSYRVVQVTGDFGFSEPTTRTQNALLCAMIALIVWLAYDEFAEIYHELKAFKWRIYPTFKSHLSDFWNLMDIATLVIASLLLYLQFYQFEIVGEMLLNPDNMDASKYAPKTNTAYARIYICTVRFCAPPQNI